MKYKIFLFLLTIMGGSCSQANKKSDTQKDAEIERKTFYIETVNFGSDLNRCFQSKIFNKWSSIDFQLKDSTEIFTEKKPNEIHFFTDIKNFDTAHTDKHFEKIIVQLYEERTAKNTKYTIERFQYQGNGAWQRIGNLGDFTATSKENNSTKLGKEPDTDQLCLQIVATTVKASYK